MKVDTLTNQQSEHQHYINVLKDQIKTKEQQSSMFNADVCYLCSTLLSQMLMFSATSETFLTVLRLRLVCYNGHTYVLCTLTLFTLG